MDPRTGGTPPPEPYAGPPIRRDTTDKRLRGAVLFSLGIAALVIGWFLTAPELVPLLSRTTLPGQIVFGSFVAVSGIVFIRGLIQMMIGRAVAWWLFRFED
jgi:hypothetical protein